MHCRAIFLPCSGLSHTGFGRSEHLQHRYWIVGVFRKWVLNQFRSWIKVLLFSYSPHCKHDCLQVQVLGELNGWKLRHLKNYKSLVLGIIKKEKKMNLNMEFRLYHLYRWFCKKFTIEYWQFWHDSFPVGAVTSTQLSSVHLKEKYYCNM